MKTKYLQFNDKDLTAAGELIRQGELVAFPTETVYGLGANAFNVNAVKNSYSAKGRPSDNPLIVHVYDKSQIYDIAREVSSDAEKIIDSLLPASLTIVLPKRDVIDDCITAGLDTVAIRMPLSVQARKFSVLHKKVTVVTDPKAIVNSPGVRYKHYAPRVPMALDVSGDADKLARYYDELTRKGYNPVLLVEHPEAFGGRNVRLIGRTDEEVARSLFENLRVLETQFDYIIASFSSKTQFAESILNRLTRSAGHNII